METLEKAFVTRKEATTPCEMTVLSSFFSCRSHRFPLAFPGGQAGLKRKEVKGNHIQTFSLVHSFNKHLFSTNCELKISCLSPEEGSLLRETRSDCSVV